MEVAVVEDRPFLKVNVMQPWAFLGVCCKCNMLLIIVLIVHWHKAVRW